MPDVKLLTIAADGSVSMELDVAAPPLTGMDALFQRVILKFLKTPGSDIIRLRDGGGLQSLLFSGATSATDPQVTAEAAEVVRKVRRGVIEDQQGLNLPASERLRDLVIDEIVADPSAAELAITVSLVSEAGQTAYRTIGL